MNVKRCGIMEGYIFVTGVDAGVGGGFFVGWPGVAMKLPGVAEIRAGVAGVA